MAETSRVRALREQVREGYARIARGRGSCGCGAGASCCGSCSPKDPGGIARAVGYAEEDLEGLPAGADMGLSCGNPLALAGLRPGEVVLDLGSGGGLDVFQAARRVGPRGRAIGVDMTPEMLSKARRNAEVFARRARLRNVEFRLGEIEHLPVADASVDVVLSNCVINLSPDKPQVWREIARVLRPGGRVSVSDMALLRPLPAAVRRMAETLVGCVAGAVTVRAYGDMVRAAGLAGVRLEPRPAYVRALVATGDPMVRRIARRLPCGTGPADFITSLAVEARKPGRRSRCPCASPEKGRL